MQSLNILSQILTYLSYQDLLACSQTNKLFRSVSKNPSLWRREALRIGIGNLDFFGEALAKGQKLQKTGEYVDWKQILKEFLNSKQN